MGPTLPVHQFRMDRAIPLVLVGVWCVLTWPGKVSGVSLKRHGTSQARGFGEENYIYAEDYDGRGNLVQNEMRESNKELEELTPQNDAEELTNQSDGREVTNQSDGEDVTNQSDRLVNIYNHDLNVEDFLEDAQQNTDEFESHLEGESQKPAVDTYTNNYDSKDQHGAGKKNGGPEAEVNAAEVNKTHDIHGGVKMGVKNRLCDDGKTDLQKDWDNSTDWEYTCQASETVIPVNNLGSEVVQNCLPKEEIPKPLHECMFVDIVYQDIPPRGGRHRPIWPVYGEYLYCPPQRWVHVLEHGAAVFLYHPCANRGEIEKLKDIARGCLRKHVITPYRPLGTEQPFAVLTWGCKLQSSYVNTAAVIDFVRTRAQQAAESAVARDGEYDAGLLHKAELVSTLQESDLCPMVHLDAEHMIRQSDSDEVDPPPTM